MGENKWRGETTAYSLGIETSMSQDGEVWCGLWSILFMAIEPYMVSKQGISPSNLLSSGSGQSYTRIISGCPVI